jgi:hypothetical protein
VERNATLPVVADVRDSNHCWGGLQPARTRKKMAKVPLRKNEMEMIVSASERMAKLMNGRYEVDPERVELLEEEPPVEAANDDDDDPALVT